MTCRIEQALLKTPLERNVRLEMDRQDPSRPLLRQVGPLEDEAVLYLVNKKGLPIWWPASHERRQAQKFFATFIVSLDVPTNFRRAQQAAYSLANFARKKLAARRWGLKAARTAKRRGYKPKGRPPGIPRAQERTGTNRGRLCLECGQKAGSHRRKGICPSWQGERA